MSELIPMSELKMTDAVLMSVRRLHDGKSLPKPAALFEDVTRALVNNLRSGRPIVHARDR
jgi:hypothetical protein